MKVIITILGFLVISWYYSFGIERIIYVNNEIEEVEKVEEIKVEEKWLHAEASAYTSRVEETDDTPCISANGMNICQYDGCLVASNQLELNSYIEIEGFGKCLVADKMNRRYKNNIDIYFRDYNKALKFGRKIISYRKING